MRLGRWSRAALAAGTCAAVLWVAGAPAQAASPKDVVKKFIKAVNRHDVNAVMSFYTSKPVVKGDICNPACVGLRSVRRVEERDAADHIHVTLFGIKESGSTVKSRFALRSDTVRATPGVVRVVGDVTFTLKGDKIAAIDGTFDRSDRQTAKFLAE